MRGLGFLKRGLGALAILGILATAASAQSCICAKYPMYPVTGGWYHYATVHAQAGCVYQYPTGHVDGYSYNEVCGPACGTCSSLGGTDTPPPNLFVGTENSMPPSYGSLDTDKEVRKYLKDTAPDASEAGKYDEMEFSRPYPTNYTKPFCLKLTRNVDGSDEEFFAIVWQVSHKEAPTTPRGYFGIEVSSKPTGVSIIEPKKVCTAVDTQGDGDGNVTHTPIPGLLQATFSVSGGSAMGEAVAFIRLQNTKGNQQAMFPPCHE